MTVYSIASFGMMIADGVRMRAYAAALQSAVRPGSTVMDIGAGTGVLTLLACRYGAARVYAIDPNPAVSLVREAARLNGVEDRVVVVADVSTSFTPDRPIDVVVSDLRGVLPFWEGHIESIADARDRLLAPGGVLIPEADVVQLCVISAPEKYAELVRPWENVEYKVDLSAARVWALNSWLKYRFEPGQLLTPAVPGAVIDYREVTTADSRFAADVEIPVTRSGVAHGVGAWFDARLSGEIGFSNAPGEPDALYGRAFFPWEQPVELSEGWTVHVHLGAWPVNGRYVWRWSSRVTDHRGDIVAESDQSTFRSTPPDAAQFARGAATYVPQRGREIEMDAFVLAQVSGSADLKEISGRLYREFPEEFAGEHAALDYVAACCRRYP